MYSTYKKPQRLPAKVISVGNLTLGGTGKTPAVIAIAEEAKKRGASPCILTRGYKGRSKGPCFIGRVQGSEVRGHGEKAPCCLPLDPSICGDEPVLMAERLKDVPIVKCADRYQGGMFALTLQPSAFGPQPPVFILDDGFQHWNLYRDIDILLIDASDPFGNEKLFPEGRLREPLRSMKRAHVIVLTKADAVNDGTIKTLTGKIKRYNPDAPVFSSAKRSRHAQK
jgi:tetraacyldisaccharide 4'-kinase